MRAVGILPYIKYILLTDMLVSMFYCTPNFNANILQSLSCLAHRDVVVNRKIVSMFIWLALKDQQEQRHPLLQSTYGVYGIYRPYRHPVWLCTDYLVPWRYSKTIIVCQDCHPRGLLELLLSLQTYIGMTIR